MALIKCPECDNVVSTAARTCPTCGYPIVTDDNTDVSTGLRKEINELKQQLHMVRIEADVTSKTWDPIAEIEMGGVHVVSRHIIAIFLLLAGLIVIAGSIWGRYLMGAFSGIGILLGGVWFLHDARSFEKRVSQRDNIRHQLNRKEGNP